MFSVQAIFRQPIIILENKCISAALIGWLHKKLSRGIQTPDFICKGGHFSLHFSAKNLVFAYKKQCQSFCVASVLKIVTLTFVSPSFHEDWLKCEKSPWVTKWKWQIVFCFKLILHLHSLVFFPINTCMKLIKEIIKCSYVFKNAEVKQISRLKKYNRFAMPCWICCSGKLWIKKITKILVISKINQTNKIELQNSYFNKKSELKKFDIAS